MVACTDDKIGLRNSLEESRHRVYGISDYNKLRTTIVVRHNIRDVFDDFGDIIVKTLATWLKLPNFKCASEVG
jgi:hypothetical protein